MAAQVIELYAVLSLWLELCTVSESILSTFRVYCTGSCLTHVFVLLWVHAIHGLCGATWSWVVSHWNPQKLYQSNPSDPKMVQVSV